MDSREARAACPRCSQLHDVQDSPPGLVTQNDGRTTREGPVMHFVQCDNEKAYLVGIDGKYRAA